MRLSRADLIALLIALGAAIAGVVVWNHGTVDLGMTLVSDGERVRVHDVTPDGNAARAYMYPGMAIIEIVTTDGSDVERGEELGAGLGSAFVADYFPWQLDNFRGESIVLEGDDRWPVEAVPSRRIAMAYAAEVATWEELGEEYVEIYNSGMIDRSLLEFELQQSIWISALGLLFGALVWRLLAHGLAGSFGRDHALVVGAAIAVPALINPVIEVGTPAGIAAGFLVPTAVALVLGLSMARLHPEQQWVQTAMIGSVVAAALAAVLVLRQLTSPSLGGGDHSTLFALIAAITVVPAAITALGPGRQLREQVSLGSLALTPVAALTFILPLTPAIVLPMILLAVLIGWQVLPLERAFAALGRGFGVVGGGFDRMRSRSATVAAPPEQTIHPQTRDVLTLGLFAIVTFFGITSAHAVLAILGVAVAALVGLALRNGILGLEWSDGAIPVAAAVGIPIAVAGFESWSSGGEVALSSAAIAMAGLSVAHVLAARHSDPVWRRRLLAWSAGLAAVSIFFGFQHLPLALLMGGVVPLIPGLPTAFADADGQPRAVTQGLETLAIALTPAAAVSVLTSLSWVPLTAWLIAIVVWRRYTLAPLLGIAQRTQLQRDVAVAAAETERARLAADLHDDALQQLTMLVRTLDESGNTDAANEAREVATKLRSVVGDLRLPILDDLGAGAALEWLVERVEPLAGGPVKLERSDATRPPANVELAVFRVAQEALTNAIKHGKTPIAVRYDVRSDGRVSLAIDDNGPGIGSDAAEEAPGAGHFGLLNMHQRAEQIGALLDVRRWPAGGTRVALEWRPQGS
jgi:signal transduction histidine kinase